VVKAGDTLVTVGKAGQYAAFRRLLADKEPAPEGRS
jgi:K+/H+ antiporter YhaU regulatory subunit KhtT